MELIAIVEASIFFLGIYYLYYFFSSYSTIKGSKKFFRDYKYLVFFSLLGSTGMVLSFQTYCLTTFYIRHTYIEIFIKIALGILSLINQLTILMIDEEAYNIKHRRHKGRLGGYIENTDRLIFQVTNKLFLLDIVYKFFNRNGSGEWMLMFNGTNNY